MDTMINKIDEKERQVKTPKAIKHRNNALNTALLNKKFDNNKRETKRPQNKLETLMKGNVTNSQCQKTFKMDLTRIRQNITTDG